MAWARPANGRQQTAKTSCTMRYKRYKEKVWKTTKELDRHHTTRCEKHRHDLGSSATARCQQRSTCRRLNVSLTRDELRSKVSSWLWEAYLSSSHNGWKRSVRLIGIQCLFNDTNERSAAAIAGSIHSLLRYARWQHKNNKTQLRVVVNPVANSCIYCKLVVSFMGHSWIMGVVL